MPLHFPKRGQRQESYAVTIIPGNRYFRLGGEGGVFHQLLPLEVQGDEGRLHREICPSGEVGFDY